MSFKRVDEVEVGLNSMMGQNNTNKKQEIRKTC